MMARFLLAGICTSFVLSLTLAEVPSYIKICGRRNPQLDKCLENSVKQLTPKLKFGIPELDVPSLEPLLIEKVPLANLDDFRAFATNVKLRGLTNFTVNHLNVDFEKQKIDLEVSFARIYMDADYDVKAKILVPISEKGPINTYTDEVLAKVQMKMQIVERRGRKLLYFPTMTTKLRIKDYTATFMPGSETNPVAQAINSVLANSRQEIIASMTPNIEKAISQKVLTLSNQICKHFTYEELFPDTI